MKYAVLIRCRKIDVYYVRIYLFSTCCLALGLVILPTLSQPREHICFMYICWIFASCLNTLIRCCYMRRTMPQTKPTLCPFFFSITYLYVEYAEDPNTVTPFVCCVRNTVGMKEGMGKCLQSDLRFRIKRLGQRTALALQTFLYLIPSSPLSYCSCIRPLLLVLFQTPQHSLN